MITALNVLRTVRDVAVSLPGIVWHREALKHHLVVIPRNESHMLVDCLTCAKEWRIA